MIDAIFMNEAATGSENIETLKSVTRQWARGKRMPPNVEAVVLRVRQEQEEKRLRAEELARIDAMAATAQGKPANKRKDAEQKEELSSAELLCRRYGIKIDLLDSDKQEVKEQLKSFCMTENAFQKFKTNSSIDKTLSIYNKGLKDAAALKERLMKREQEAARKRKEKQRQEQERMQSPTAGNSLSE